MLEEMMEETGSPSGPLPPVPVCTQPELLRLDVPERSGPVLAEEIEQWQQDMVGIIGHSSRSRLMSHPEEGTLAGVPLSPCPDSPPPETPARQGDGGVHWMGADGDGVGGQWAFGPCPSTMAALPVPPCNPPPYDGSGIVSEFGQFKAMVEGIVPRAEHQELRHMCTPKHGS